METHTVTAHLPKDLVSKVDVLAARLDRPRGWVVREALLDWIALEEERHRLTLAGLADVDAGRLVDHEHVVAWAQSLSTDEPLDLPKA